MIHAIFPKQNRGYATIALSAYQSAQGPVLREFCDGRVMIDTGRSQLTGRPMNQPPQKPAWMPVFGLAY
ncbi:hypothetical protein [Paracoccus sp. (in: a-proteobacteria)]|uniref:hypothetical protein n=1 Tax=Paracoccus sp. TaxID=267 RepID=UPI0028AE4731|nr:hypothetical protein [Paracoccus sp. (in: a-proteobacteria)]